MGRSAYARSLRVGVIIGLVLAAVAVGVLVLGREQLVKLAGGTSRVRSARAVLLVAAAPDDSGAVVAQVVARADLASGAVRAIDPSSTVTIPGTSYSALKDAYAFGGGAAVASAYARQRGEATLPYVAVSAEALSAAVDRSGGMQVTLPASMNVFDGSRLYEFPSGAATLSGPQLLAVLRGTPYLAPVQRTALEATLAEGYAHLLAAWPGGLAEAVSSGDVSSDLSAALCERLQTQLGKD